VALLLISSRPCSRTRHRTGWRYPLCSQTGRRKKTCHVITRGVGEEEGTGYSCEWRGNERAVKVRLYDVSRREQAGAGWSRLEQAGAGWSRLEQAGAGGSSTAATRSEGGAQYSRLGPRRGGRGEGQEEQEGQAREKGPPPRPHRGACHGCCLPRLHWGRKRWAPQQGRWRWLVSGALMLFLSGFVFRAFCVGSLFAGGLLPESTTAVRSLG